MAVLKSVTIASLKAGMSSGFRLDPIDDDLFIHPARARVLEIGLERWPRGDSASLHGAGFDHRPRTMADDGDRFAGVGMRRRANAGT